MFLEPLGISTLCPWFLRTARGDPDHRRARMFGNSCYLFQTESGLTWEEARIFCKRLGSDLVAVETANERNFVLDIIDKSAADMKNSNDSWMVGALRKANSNTEHYWVATGLDMPYHASEWFCNLESCNTHEANKYVHLTGQTSGRKFSHGAFVEGNFICEKKKNAPQNPLDSDDCQANPCTNGATCTDFSDGYTCKCVAGYEGATCATDINECQHRPCMNGGICTDHLNRYACECKTGFTGVHCEHKLSIDKVHDLSLEVEGGGWQVIQKRVSPNTDLPIWDKNWEAYKDGFGNISSAYWMGLEKLHSLTTDGRKWQLMVQVRWKDYNDRAKNWSYNGEVGWEIYDDFWVDSEAEAYAMHIGNLAEFHSFSYEEDPSYSVKGLFRFLNGYKFNTKDRDNDGSDDYNCSIQFNGNGWWASNCWYVNMNTRGKIDYWFGKGDKGLLAVRPTTSK